MRNARFRRYVNLTFDSLIYVIKMMNCRYHSNHVNYINQWSKLSYFTLEKLEAQNSGDEHERQPLSETMAVADFTTTKQYRTCQEIFARWYPDFRNDGEQYQDIIAELVTP